MQRHAAWRRGDGVAARGSVMARAEVWKMGHEIIYLRERRNGSL
jgi:hypothetical protein